MTELYHQPSMAAGEIGPHLYGRVDQDLYYIGMKTVRNFHIRQYGGASNRAGLMFVNEQKTPDKSVRLIPFTFNEEQTYCLQFGDEFMRVIKNGAEVTATAQNITAITKANPCVITYSGSDTFSNGDDVYISGIVGMVELNGRTVRVKNVNTGANTFEITDFLGNNIDSTNFSTYVSGGTVAEIYTLTTPWQDTDLFDLDGDTDCLVYAQSNDVLTVVHPDYYPRDITRTADNVWTIGLFDNEEGPFKDVNGTATTIQASAATGTGITLTASASLFSADWVGELLYIEQEPTDSTTAWEPGKSVSSGNIRKAGSHYYEAVSGSTTGTVRPDWVEGTFSDGGVTWKYLHSGFGIVRIASYSSATSVTADVIKTLPGNVVSAATDIWARAAWSSTEGYPSAVTYHKQRMMFAGTTQKPNGLWMSAVQLRAMFGKSKPVLSDEAITMELNTGGSNNIRHLLPFSELIALTAASEHLINGVDDVIDAAEVPFAKVQGYTGASRVPPIIINNTALFVEDLGGVIRSLRYQLDSDTFGGIDLTARSPHLFENKRVIDWSFQRHPLSIIWTCMDDGSLNGFTYMEEQKVYAWHRHDSGPDGEAEFESVCCIREGRETAAYFSVKRTVNGTTRRYTERMASRFFSTIRDAKFVDSGLTYDGRNNSATTMTITGGTTWDTDDTVTITASASTFLSTDVGNQLVFWVYDETNEINIAYRLTITAYTSGTVVSATPTKLIPADYRSTAFTDWEMARSVMRPLNHLEGEEVIALADGNVVRDLTVTNGAVTLDYPAAVVHVGLRYDCDLETLDMSRPSTDPSKLKTFNIPRVFLTVQESRSVKVGINGADDLKEIKQRTPQMGYDDAIPAETGTFEVLTNSSWSRTGRIFVRQDAPLPITVNCISPEVSYGEK